MPDINKTDLVARLREACVGHPHAKIEWPHRVLHEAADAIEALMREIETERRTSRGDWASQREVDAYVIENASQAAEISRLRDDLALRDDLLIKAEKFRFAPSLTVESRGPSQWAVCDTGEVQNAAGEWEREPQPSSRSEEFIARTRFTFAEAVRRARTALEAKP